MEENLRSHKSFVSDIDFKLLFRDTVESGVVFDPLYNVGFIFSKFFRDIWAHVAKSLFDRLKNENYNFFEIKEDSLLRLQTIVLAELRIRGLLSNSG
jgi:hypothetical protein